MNKNYEEIESSQRQHFNLLEHNERMYQESMKADFILIPILKPKIYQDGNQWCVLYGENIQDGICGFGDTIRKAIQDFNSVFEKEIK